MISLDEVAEDAVAIIKEFRAVGKPFGSLPVDQARGGYLASCLRNGLPTEPVDEVTDITIPVSGGQITLRRYRPAGAGPGPCVVFLHGGGWALGGLQTHDAIARFVAVRSGTQVVAVDYRLAPEHRHPVPLDDCLSALRHVQEHGVALGIDPSRLILLGDSAGGGLAAAIANDPALAVEGGVIVGQMLLYPAVDLSSESDSYARVTEGFALTAGSMRWFRDLYLGPEGDPADPRVSPLHLIGPVVPPPPAFVVTVGFDPLCDEGIAFAGRLAQLGGRVEHHHLPRHAHGLFTAAGRISTGAKILERAAAFIREIGAQ